MAQISEQQFQYLVDSLCDTDHQNELFRNIANDIPMPSNERLNEITSALLTLLFPGFFGESDIKPATLRYHIGTTISKIFPVLEEQIKRGFCFQCQAQCQECSAKAGDICLHFFQSLPQIRRMLAADAQAAYLGDPAADSIAETIFCYPSLRAIASYRIAHQLHILGVPLIPRMISEIAHSETGIDIHPAATIQEGFFIDHGTGTVIGATCEIGRNVRLYQGVTLGAKSFALDDAGNPVKGVPRHPIVEDDVIVYSGATILGRITIGKGSVVGGNVWLTHSIAPMTRVMQGKVNKKIFHGSVNPDDPSIDDGE